MDGEQFDRDTGEIVATHRLATSYNWSTPCGELFAAMALAQVSVENVEREGTNPGFKTGANPSRYVKLGGVLDEVRGKYAAQGIAIVQMPINGAGQNIGIVTMFAHKSGQWMESTLYVAPTKFDAQGAGSVITYLRRYALMAMAGVAPDDDDGSAGVSRPSEPSNAAHQAQGSPPAATRTTNRPQAAPAPSEKRAEAARRIQELKLEIASAMTSRDAASWRSAPAWNNCATAVEAAKIEEGASGVAAIEAAGVVMDELSARIDRRIDMLNEEPAP